jgi:hypothetical protein
VVTDDLPDHLSSDAFCVVWPVTCRMLCSVICVMYYALGCGMCYLVWFVFMWSAMFCSMVSGLSYVVGVRAIRCGNG